MGHTKPTKAQLSPYKKTPIFYGSIKQFTADTNTSAPIDAKGILRVQKFVSALLYYGRNTDKKLLVALSAIGYQKAAATLDTSINFNQLLDYIEIYPHSDITYRSSNIILAAHSDASYLNGSLSHIRTGSHIFSHKITPCLHLMHQFPPPPR